MLPRGSLPLNVEVTLTAPDLMLPETETPFAPLSAMFNVGSAVRAAPELPASTTAATPTTRTTTARQPARPKHKRFIRRLSLCLPLGVDRSLNSLQRKVKPATSPMR